MGHRALTLVARALLGLVGCAVFAATAHAQGGTSLPGSAAGPVVNPAPAPGPTSVPALAAGPQAATPLSPATPGTPPSSSAGGASASPGGAHRVVYTLASCLAMADVRSAQIQIHQDKLAQAHAQLDEVRWAPWSQFTITGGAALVPEIRGSAVYSPQGDISLSSSLGPAWRVTVEGVVPIYTFGKISSANAAAAAAVDVASHDIDRMRLVVHHDVRRAFFGLQLARDARYLLSMASDKLDDAISHAEDNAEADEADVLKMKTYRAEVSARLGEVEKNERMALAGLRFLTGIQPPAPFDIPDEPIAPPKKALGEPLVYLSSARSHRPELKMARAGVAARRAQLDLAHARLYPDLGLGLSFGYANAPIIADQTNPFVVDNANYLRYGFGLVFRWNLDLFPGSARVRYAEAQLAELRHTEAYALGGIGVEVENALAAATDASIRAKEYGQAEQLAKRWVASVTAAVAVGTKEDRDVVDPLRAFLTNRFSHLQAIMDLDVSVSSLSVATGDETFAEF